MLNRMRNFFSTSFHGARRCYVGLGRLSIRDFMQHLALHSAILTFRLDMPTGTILALLL